MREPHRIDANLLVMLDAILSESSLTRAAEALHVNQPVVSAALSRLRAQLGDPLLEREGRSYRLTSRAEQLRPIVRQAIDESMRTWNMRRDFDPARSDRRFVIGASDLAIWVVAAPLFDLFEREAPGLSVAFESIPFQQTHDQTLLTRRDLVIASEEHAIPGRRRKVFQDRFVLVGDARNEAISSGTVDLDELAALSFVLAKFGPTPTIPEEMLESLGIEPRTTTTVGSYSAIPWMLTGQAQVSIIPRRLFMRFGSMLGLIEVTSPLPPLMLVESAHWSPERGADPGIRWLLRALSELSFETTGMALTKP